MNRVDDSGNAVDIKTQQVYKIEVAANRYDLLCLEGLTYAFRSFLGYSPLPRFTVKENP